MTPLTLRCAADLLLFGSVLYFPWWVGMSLALVFFFAFPTYVEMLLAALFTDLLYAAPTERFGGFLFVLSISSLVVFVLCGILKRHLRIPHSVY
jgi:hypothetical protein